MAVQQSAPAAIVDIGSASAVVQVVAAAAVAGARGDDPRGGIVELARDKVSLRLGAALVDGAFPEATLDRVVGTLSSFAALARAHGVDPTGRRMLAVATEAMRRAANGAALCARVEANAGVRLHIIDGPTEAALAFLAVRMRYPVGALVAVDIGGGSTEIAYGGAERPEVAVSLPAGAVLYGRYGLDGVTDAPTLERVRAEVDRLLAASSLPPGTIGAGSGVRALGTSGSIQRCARLLKARDGEPGDSPDGRLITRDDLSWLVAALAGRSLEARRAMPGMDPERADILLAGALILERVGVFLGVETWQVATTGLRTALAAIALGAAPPPAGLTLDARMDARLIDSVG